MSKIDSKILDNIIYGRVLPQIYAFQTNTIPNYLKIGDTFRPLEIRINEWKRKYPDLELEFSDNAIVENDIYFRDYSVHKYLESQNIERLSIEQLRKISKDTYYSDEFFKNVSSLDIEHAIEDIIEQYPSDIYDYYKISNENTKIKTNYQRIEDFYPRKNQADTINSFLNAIENNRTKLLMFAVMRFGKTITSLWCAKAIEAKVVVVVSGKADVRQEWKKNVESHVDFSDPEYVFITSEQMRYDNNLIKKLLNQNKRVVLFFTLQDFLKGNSNSFEDENAIKSKHRELFELSDKGMIDLLLIDETHYGARAKEFSKVLDDGIQDIDKLYNLPKTIRSKITMHLSGTPYKILMDTEFDKEDIVAFYQFSDIIDDQTAWNNDENNLDKDEWENPYYGFPQMIRFAFNLNKKSRERLIELKQDGIQNSVSNIFEPISTKNTGKYRKFLYEEEVFEFLKTIDGGEQDEELLSFLDNSQIKEGKLCQHIVMVLPYRASCDAMEQLIKTKLNKFNNLSEYNVLNISGFDQPRRYNGYDGVATIKREITDSANKGQKTITLTVNRLLTGTTVKEWDTMIYLKGGYSPQEYDQATFRLQNPWIKEYHDENGKLIKYNMKPQTLLIDFDPTRMFIMIEEKAKIYNVNTDNNGNDQLYQRIEKELSISPLLWLDSKKLKEVKPINIIDKIREYSSEKSVVDEAKSIAIDYRLLEIDAIRKEIDKQKEMGSKGGLEIEPFLSDQQVDITQELNDIVLDVTNDDNENNDDNNEYDDDKIESMSKKMQTYYSRILFFSFLTKHTIKSLSDIINVISLDEDNNRIAFNLGLSKDILKLIKENINPFILSSLEYKIFNINTLANDKNKTEIERARIAIKHFDRFSSSEINTPSWIATDIVNMIDEELIIKLQEKNSNILDVASKSGEFAVAFYEKLFIYDKSLVNILKDSVVSIPTSNFAYEFTRKTYEILGLNINNVISGFTSYDLLNMINKNYDVAIDKISNNIEYHEKNIFKLEENKKMNFDIIIGNPPYQDKGGSGGNNDAAIYQHFVEFANRLNPEFSSMIIPARWFAAGRENLLGNFRREFINSKEISDLVVYPNAKDVFKNVQIEGGVCYYKRNLNPDFELTNYRYISEGKTIKTLRKLNDFDIFIADTLLSNIVKKVSVKTKEDNLKTIDMIVSTDTPFGIASNPKTSKKTPTKVYSSSSINHDTKLFHIERSKRKIEYVDGSLIKKNNEDIMKDKVFITGSYGGHRQVLSYPELAGKNSVCSQSYLYAAFEDEIQAMNFIKYLKTKFFRVLVSAMKITQSAPNRVYKFVPYEDLESTSRIDWSQPINQIDEQLFELYNITSEERKYIVKRIAEMI